MKLNNRGISLSELIISIVLISGIMLFLYSLLYNINKDYYDASFASDNQTVRFEIIDTIQRDILENKLTDITINNQVVEFVFVTSKSTLTIYEDKLTYTEVNNANNTFNLKGATLDNNISITQEEIDASNYLTEINIKINENYKQDDITLTFVTDFKL